VELIVVTPSQKYGFIYTTGRLVLFLAVAVVFFALGLRRFALVLAALLVSVPLSYVLLKPIRLKWSAEIDKSLRHRRESKQKLRSALRGDDQAS
jgi:hypothetical protein